MLSETGRDFLIGFVNFHRRIVTREILICRSHKRSDGCPLFGVVKCVVTDNHPRLIIFKNVKNLILI